MVLKWVELIGVGDSRGTRFPPEPVLIADDALTISFRKAALEDIRHTLPANVCFKVYANRAAYDADREPLSDESPVGALGASKENAIVVVVLMRWTTTTVIDLDASSLPFSGTDDSQTSTWKLDADAIAGFGVRCRGAKLVLSRRQDAVELCHFLRNDVLRDGRCGYFVGPPGSGKSATAAAFALTLAHTCWVVTWIGLACLECVRLENRVKKTSPLSFELNGLIPVLNGVKDTKSHVVFLDGLTMNKYAVVQLCYNWLKQNPAKRRLVVVASMASRVKRNEAEDASVAACEYIVSSWKLDEYFHAVQDGELFQSVKPHLDVSNDAESDWEMDMESSHGGGTSKGLDAADIWRQSLVRSKYYFAGGSARYMFGFPTANVVSNLDMAVASIPNAEPAAMGTVGDRSRDAINRLYCRFRGGAQPGIISGYAGVAVATMGGPALIKKLVSVLGEDINAAMEGWILEMYFFACIRKGGVTLYDGDQTITWPEEQIQVVDPLNLPRLPTICWLKPQKYNQGGYDAVYIDMTSNLVRFVQVTRAHTHTFHIRYFEKFLKSLLLSVSSFEVKTLEIFFVIEKGALPDFKFSKITGEGLLAIFPDWGKGQEADRVKLVGIRDVKSWDSITESLHP